MADESGYGGQPSPRPRLASRSLGEGWWSRRQVGTLTTSAPLKRRKWWSIGESTLSLIANALRKSVAVWLQEKRFDQPL